MLFEMASTKREILGRIDQQDACDENTLNPLNTTRGTRHRTSAVT